jgi:hypothetical protein
MSTRAVAPARSRHGGSGHSARHTGVSGVHAKSSKSIFLNTATGQVELGGSRANSGTRIGTELSELGVLQSYDSGSNTAMVQLLGAAANTVGPLSVNKAISSALLVAGAQCLVVLMDAENPSDGALVSVW